jgi:hypothetical protein
VVDEEAIAATFGRCIGDGGVDAMDSFPFAAILRCVRGAQPRWLAPQIRACFKEIGDYLARSGIIFPD